MTCIYLYVYENSAFIFCTHDIGKNKIPPRLSPLGSRLIRDWSAIVPFPGTFILINAQLYVKTLDLRDCFSHLQLCRDNYQLIVVQPWTPVIPLYYIEFTLIWMDRPFWTTFFQTEKTGRKTAEKKTRPTFRRKESLQDSSDSSACAPETLVTPRAAGWGATERERGARGFLGGWVGMPAQLKVFWRSIVPDPCSVLAQLKALRRHIFFSAQISLEKELCKTIDLNKNAPNHISIRWMNKIPQISGRRCLWILPAGSEASMTEHSAGRILAKSRRKRWF